MIIIFILKESEITVLKTSPSQKSESVRPARSWSRNSSEHTSVYDFIRKKDIESDSTAVGHMCYPLTVMTVQFDHVFYCHRICIMIILPLGTFGCKNLKYGGIRHSNHGNIPGWYPIRLGHTGFYKNIDTLFIKSVPDTRAMNKSASKSLSEKRTASISFPHSFPLLNLKNN